MTRPAEKSDLIPDCDNCSGLCCIAPEFKRSTQFAFNKAPGFRCRHLDKEFRCRIHDNLAMQGFQGCAEYQCYGAGQKVTKKIYGGRTWLSHPELAERIFRTYFIVKALHELLGYLNEAAEICADAVVRAKIEERRVELETLSIAREETLNAADIADHKKKVQILIAAAHAAN